MRFGTRTIRTTTTEQEFLITSRKNFQGFDNVCMHTPVR